LALPKIDYSKLSFDELCKLKNKIISEHDKQSKTGKKEAISKIRALAIELDITPNEIFGKKQTQLPVTDKRKKVSPKYKAPSTGKTWSGRGKKPTWVQQ